MTIITAEKARKKYFDKYIDYYKNIDGLIEVRKVYSTIHENTSLGQDIDTELAYTR